MKLESRRSGESRSPAVLVLEDGRVFPGSSFGALGETLGEAVFATGMTGYQETLTDPSYHRQIVVMTAPHIGNTGLNDDDDESTRVWVAGYVIRDPAPIASNWRSQRSLEDGLREAAVVGICDVDTRAVTRHLRDRGAMRAGIFSGSSHHAAITHANWSEFVDRVRASPGMKGKNLTAEVSCPVTYEVPAVGSRRWSVVAVDLGMKSMTPQIMAERGMHVTVVPAATGAEEILALGPDGVFFSNGPGDPAAATTAVATMEAVLRKQIPVFGICFGHQILGRALNLPTYKMQFGHRGLNQPVQDLRTGKVAVTAHNHGFAVEAEIGRAFPTPFGLAEVSHVNLNDDVVEGLRCLDIPAFSVQYHPEAAAGTHDAVDLFDDFAALMQQAASGRSA
ncbi:MAG: glutamine-hydrolyzing carbamoyl-phosphate synthase small subunit [Actinomycetales bacterium]